MARRAFGGGMVAPMAVGGVTYPQGTRATAIVAISSLFVVVAIQTGDALEIVVHTGLAAGIVTMATIGARTTS
ncbi:hypothetical protein [Tateyamaria pelophila]|uniref:hypothetical protein n=1 Tax=Tateyamaria pelophila TaxID=328415 RepID=UPI001CC10AF2|nr:hypothetical protein [Tateyamaria pelophila]